MILVTFMFGKELLITLGLLPNLIQLILSHISENFRPDYTFQEVAGFIR